MVEGNKRDIVAAAVILGAAVGWSQDRRELRERRAEVTSLAAKFDWRDECCPLMDGDKATITLVAGKAECAIMRRGPAGRTVLVERFAL